MKKLVLSFILFSFIGFNGLYAQCTPDVNITHPGTYPDSATGLPHAKVGTAYSTVIQVRVLTDTTVSSIPATVDSIVVSSVTGLPAGFNYATNPSSGHFPGGSNGCVLLTGAAPTSGMEGSHPLTINLIAYGKLSGTIPASLPYSVTYYNIHIDSINVGIADLNAAKFSLSQNFPDPASRLTDIYYSVPSSGVIDFSMYNLLGKLVYQKSIYAEKGTGRVTLDAKDFAPGIYMYNLSNGKTKLTRRMVIANN
jgi:hypothetical protein